MTASSSTANDYRLKASELYHSALSSYTKTKPQTDLLYDPSSVGSTSSSSSSSTKMGPPINLTTFPKLLATGTDDTMNSHKSYKIAQAIADYSTKMSTLDQEYNKLKKQDQTFNGHSSSKLAEAFQKYAKTNNGKGLPANFVKSQSANKYTSYAVGGSGGSAMSGLAGTTTLLLSSGAYSWAALLMKMQWARVLYCIVWIVAGLLLVFYGYASMFWLNKVGSRGMTRKGVQAGLVEALPGIKSQKRQQQQSGQQRKRPFLSGGVGGLLVGFLFFSYLASVINNALCANEGKKVLGAGAYFAVWLAPGLLGAVLGGYFFFMAKIMTGVLGATCLTVILTAMFGIQTMLVRVILLAIFSPLLTAPLLLPRINPIQTLVLNGCTSIIGVVTFLNGVALFAPPLEASSNWIDLWTMLFCMNESTTKTAITGGWGTSAFKGYIAGSVLGAVIGFVFELFLHNQSGKDADSEWNEYLGTYTQRFGVGSDGYEGKSGLDTATSMAAAARAGLFEPAPSAWHRMVDFFDSESRKPAHYGNLSGDGLQVESISEKVRRKKSSRSAKTAGGVPARFEALSKRDDFDEESSDDEERSDDDDDDDATELGSDDDGDEKKGEKKDLLSPIRNEKNAKVVGNYGGYALPRPPMISPAPSYNTSQLSGTTARSSEPGSKIHKSAHVYRDTETRQTTSASSPSSPPAAVAPQSTGPAAIPATPSLINAISRIQIAQQAARAWQDEHNKNSDNAPYKP